MSSTTSSRRRRTSSFAGRATARSLCRCASPSTRLPLFKGLELSPSMMGASSMLYACPICWVSPSRHVPCLHCVGEQSPPLTPVCVVGAIYRPRGAGPRVLTPATAASSRAARPCPTWVTAPTRSTATFCPTVRALGAAWLCVCVCACVCVYLSAQAVAPPLVKIPPRTDEQRAATDAAHSGFKKFLVHNVSELEMLMMHNRCVPSCVRAWRSRWLPRVACAATQHGAMTPMSTG